MKGKSNDIAVNDDDDFDAMVGDLSDTYYDFDDEEIQLLTSTSNFDQSLYDDDVRIGPDFFDQQIGDGEKWGLEEEADDDDQQYPSDYYYSLSAPDTSYFSRRFQTYRAAYQLKLKNLDTSDDLHFNIVNIFEHAITRILNEVNAGPNDLVGLEVSHPGLSNVIHIPFQIRRNVVYRHMVEQIEKAFQSGKDVTFDELLNIRVLTVKQPISGKGRKPRAVNHDAFLKSHKWHGGCIIQIKNNDNLCLPRALVVARAQQHKNDPNHQWNTIRQGDTDGKILQKIKARELMDQAGLADHQGPCTLIEAKKLQDVLSEYQIKIFSKNNYCALVFEGEPKDKILHIYHHENHYDVTTSMPAFFHKNKWCEQCNKAFDHNINHRCVNVCDKCYQSGSKCKVEKWKRCNKCNRNFPNYEHHKRRYEQKGAAKRKPFKSECERIYACKKCEKLVTKGESSKYKHKCGFFECHTCKDYVQKEGHKCYIQPLKSQDEEATDEELYGTAVDDLTDNQKVAKEKDEEKSPTFIFYDFETMAVEQVGQNDYGPIYQHQPNLCLVHKVCDNYRSKPLGQCSSCGPNRLVFEGLTCEKQFCHWLFSGKNGATAIAHNAKGFDGQFILRYLHEQGIKPQIIPKGLELMAIMVGKIRIIDSLNFMPMALSAMPKAYGKEELSKGHFPICSIRQSTKTSDHGRTPIITTWKI